MSISYLSSDVKWQLRQIYAEFFNSRQILILKNFNTMHFILKILKYKYQINLNLHTQ